MKILIIRLSSIGDIVLTTPVIRCLKKQIKGSEIHFLTKKSYAAVLQHNAYIDKLHFWEKNDKKKITTVLQMQNFNYIIDLHHNFRTFSIKKQLLIFCLWSPILEGLSNKKSKLFFSI